MASNKSGQKTLTWPVAWPHYVAVSWVGIVNFPGVTISTSNLSSTTVTFSLYNCTNIERTVDRCNIIAISAKNIFFSLSEC